MGLKFLVMVSLVNCVLLSLLVVFKSVKVWLWKLLGIVLVCMVVLVSVVVFVILVWLVVVVDILIV